MKFTWGIVRGVRWNTITAVLLTAGGLLQMLLLFRLLESTDFALMAIGYVYLGVGTQILSTIGNAIVFRPDSTGEQLSTLFWLNAGMGICLVFLGVPIAFLVAHFYGQPELVRVLSYTAIGLLLAALGTPFRYVLQGGLRFDQLSWAQLGAFAVAATASVILAWMGWGVYALVFGALIRILLENTLFVFFGSRLFVPRFTMKINSVRPHLRFSLFQGGERLVDMLTFHMDTLLIGKLLGMELLGQYEVVKKILLRPAGLLITALEEAAFPVMARFQRDDSFLKRTYLRSTNGLYGVLFFLYGFAGIMASPLTDLIYGSQWPGLHVYFLLFSLAVIVKTPRLSVDMLLLAKGRTDWWFYWKLAVFFLTPLYLLIGAQFGLEGVLLATVFFHLLLYWPNYQFLLSRLVNIRFSEFMSPVWRNGVLVAAALAPAWVLSLPFAGRPLLQVGVAGIVSGLLFWVLCRFRNPALLKDLQMLLKK